MVNASKNALVLEDDHGVLSVFRLVLQKAGFCVLSAQTAEAALCWTNDPTLHFDLLVADMHLFGKSGTDAAVQIRADRPNLPVLLSSGTPPGVQGRNGCAERCCNADELSCVSSEAVHSVRDDEVVD